MREPPVFNARGRRVNAERAPLFARFDAIFTLASLLDMLRQNRRKLAVDTDGRAVQDSIEREFNESMATLTPLKAKIAAADWLIDQIVYRLYGLTEKEMQAVEEERAEDA